MSIDALLQAMLGGLGSAEKSKEPSGVSGVSLAELLGSLNVGGSGQGGLDLGGILGGLLGSDADSETGLAAQTGLPANLAQSAIAMIAGKLLAGGQDREGAGALAGLLERMQSQEEVDEASLNATGLPQELAATAGIDLPEALKAVEAILALLTGSQTTSRRKKTTGTRKSSTTRSRQAKSGTTKSASPKSTTRSRTATDAAKPATKSTTRASKTTDAAKPATKSSTRSSKTTDTTKPTTKSTARSSSKTTGTAKPAAKSTTRASKTTDTAKSEGELDNLLDQWSVTG